MTKTYPVPRALLRSAGLIDVRAAADPKPYKPKEITSVEDLNEAFRAFRAHYDARHDALEAHLNTEALHAAARKLNGDGTGGLAVDTEYSRNFGSYARGGGGDVEASLKAANAVGERATIQAAFTETDNSGGGYIAPVEWDRQINKAARVESPMRRICRIVSTVRAAYSTLWTPDGWGSGWVGETASRPATTTPTFSPLVFPSGEIYANPAVTQRILDDAAIDLDAYIQENLGDEFSRQEGPAFIAGDGVNKPMGLLLYAEGGTQATAHPGGAVKVTLSGHATIIPTPDVLVDLKYGLGAPYRQNATWLMNSQTAAAISKMKDGDGSYIWREGITLDQPPTLLGRPVEIDENMPNIAAGALPIAFGDFQRGYLINDRIGTRVLRDPYSNKPFVMFYATKRVGGGLLDPNAIRLLKIAAA